MEFNTKTSTTAELNKDSIRGIGMVLYTNEQKGIWMKNKSFTFINKKEIK